VSPEQVPDPPGVRAAPQDNSSDDATRRAVRRHPAGARLLRPHRTPAFCSTPTAASVRWPPAHSSAPRDTAFARAFAHAAAGLPWVLRQRDPAPPDSERRLTALPTGPA
jgi:hypothetical protein